MLDIRRANEETAPLLWTVEDRRLDSERIVVKPTSGGFTLGYKPLPGALWRVGNAQKDIPIDPQVWLQARDKEIFFAWMDGELAGQLLVEQAENNLARVRDIRVKLAARRRGVGKAMLAMAEDWGRAKKLGGLLAETQDANAGACQFFTRCGFSLGGVDTLRYVARDPHTLHAAGLRESALFFYRFFA